MRKVEIIAEIGINHGGSITLAHEMIEEAAWTGADTIKFQTVNADLIYSQSDSLHKLFKQAEFTPTQWQELKTHVERLDKEFLSTPNPNS